MKTIRLLFPVAALLLVLVPPPLLSQEKKEPDLMKRKLICAQKVLEGVAVGDFGLIVKNAEDLIDISKSTDWKAIKKPEFELMSNEFRRAAGNLVRAAKDKNSDGSALAYVEMTLTCVKCHKYVREVRMTRLDP